MAVPKRSVISRARVQLGVDVTKAPLETRNGDKIVRLASLKPSRIFDIIVGVAPYLLNF